MSNGGGGERGVNIRFSFPEVGDLPKFNKCKQGWRQSQNFGRF